MAGPDPTSDPALRCWMPGAQGHPDFPVQNLPLGIFSPPGGAPRAGTAIGDHIVDLPALLAAGLLAGPAMSAAAAAAGTVLNPLLAEGAPARRALRTRLGTLLTGREHRAAVERCLHLAEDCTMHLPARIGDFTDFYAGIHHATNVGRLFRPQSPLLPNYKHMPIAYHGRASSLVPSPTAIRRPLGQFRLPDAPEPVFGPSRMLDCELELGIWIGPGNRLGAPIPIADAPDHIAGYCLLNDWSARDIQAFEYQPLGPFLSKSFATSISPWIVTPEALAPFRLPHRPRTAGDPPLPLYLRDDDAAIFAIELELLLSTAAMREQAMPPHRVARSAMRHLYWAISQLVAHHTIGGVNLNPGDLLGTGTISADTADGCGSLLEATAGGRTPIRLPSGEERFYLLDGDEVILRGFAHAEGQVSIGFGECRGRVLPSEAVGIRQ
ncbi:MAG: fumarylacetoacetase [Aestuariivirgaceae bacterium]